MRKTNIYSSLFLMFFGVAICIYSTHLSLYGRRGPGPGFMSFGIGGLLFLLSAYLFLKNLFLAKREGVGSAIFRNKKVNIFVLGSLIFYALFLEILGFLVDSFLVLSLLFAVSRSLKWYSIIVISFLISVVSYILFSKILNVGLPAGVLYFLR
jgi:hypothetical protein